MTVKELIEKLSQENENLHVYVAQTVDVENTEFRLVENCYFEELGDLEDESSDTPCVVIK